MTANRIPRETLREKVEKLVIWYEQNKPNSGQCIQVNCTRKELAKAFNQFPAEMSPDDIKSAPDNQFPQEIHYRGRTLLATGKHV